MDFYLGVSVGYTMPVSKFDDMANSQDYILNSFGINGYTIILTNLGLNIALDYQSFQSRAKLPVDPDSLQLLNSDFEFGNWQNYSLLVSSRFVFPVNLKLDLFAELTVGLARSISPSIISKRAGLETGEIEGSKSLSLAAGFSIGSRFYLSKKLSLDIKGEYIPFLKPTYIYKTSDNWEIEVTQNMSHAKFKATLNWDM